MSHPLVANIHRGQSYDVYIGRPRAGQPERSAPWGNPFVLGKDGDREQVIALYREWLPREAELMRRLPELKGKVLGCFCAPLPCRGDVLAELANRECEGQGSLFGPLHGADAADAAKDGGGMMTITQEKRGRPVTAEEARESCRRLINSHFNNRDQARCHIPVSASDDDVLLSDYLAEVKSREVESLEILKRFAESLEILKRFAESHEFALHVGADCPFGERVLKHLWKSGIEPKAAHLPNKPVVG